MKTFKIILFTIFISFLIIHSGCNKPDNDITTPSPADTACSNITPAIYPPTSFFAKAVSLSQVQLTWYQSSNATTYKIYKNGQYLNQTSSLNYNDNFTLTA